MTNIDVVSGGDPLEFGWYASYFEWQTADLDRWVSSIEKRAKGILKDVQATKDVLETPDGRKRMVADDALSLGIVREVEKLGFRRGQDVQWHAAAILKHLRVLRANLASEEIVSHTAAKAAAIAGIQLGALLREAEIKFGMVAFHARKGGSQPKGIPAVASFVRSRLRANRTLTASALWRSIPSDECDGLKIKDARLYVEMDLLRVNEKRNGNWTRVAELTYPAFRRYVTAARKALTR